MKDNNLPCRGVNLWRHVSVYQTTLFIIFHEWIEWLMFNANFSSISAILWHVINDKNVSFICWYSFEFPLTSIKHSFSINFNVCIFSWHMSGFTAGMWCTTKNTNTTVDNLFYIHAWNFKGGGVIDLNLGACYQFYQYFLCFLVIRHNFLHIIYTLLVYLYLQLDDIEEELDEIYTDSSTFLKVSIVIVHVYPQTVISVR